MKFKSLHFYNEAKPGLQFKIQLLGFTFFELWGCSWYEERTLNLTLLGLRTQLNWTVDK